MNAIDIELYGADAAVERGIVILASGGDADELGFDVLRDLADLLGRKLTPGKARERRSGGNHERRRAGDSGTGGGFGVSLKAEAGGRFGVGVKESQQIGREGVAQRDAAAEPACRRSCRRVRCQARPVRWRCRRWE